jgi:hypothetical protein
MLRVDLVKSDVNITSTLNRRANNPGVYSFPQASQNNVTSVPTVGPILEFDYVTRNNEVSQRLVRVQMVILSRVVGSSNQRLQYICIDAYVR